MTFTPLDPFNRQIAEIDPDSDALVQFFVKHAGSANIASDTYWGIPVYHAGADSKQYTIRSSKFDAGATFTIWMPPNIRPSLGEGKAIVFEPVMATGIQYEADFFGFTYDSKGHPQAQAVWRQRCDADSPSTTENKQGVLGHIMASGVMHSVGLIYADEITRGRIPHALAVTIPETLSRAAPDAYRPPANQTDGTHTPGVPMGAHIQLDPDYNLATLLHSTSVIVADALQRYGAYVVDTGDSFSFYGESVYTGVYPPWFDPKAIREIDWTRLRVLTN